MQVGGVVALSVQRVGDHRQAADQVQAVQQCRERRQQFPRFDLVRQPGIGALAGEVIDQEGWHPGTAPGDHGVDNHVITRAVPLVSSDRVLRKEYTIRGSAIGVVPSYARRRRGG
jgi:hypothetical protein